jgi:hypothetical protein
MNTVATYVAFLIGLDVVFSYWLNQSRWDYGKLLLKQTPLVWIVWLVSAGTTAIAFLVLFGRFAYDPDTLVNDANEGLFTTSLYIFMVGAVFWSWVTLPKDSGIQSPDFAAVFVTGVGSVLLAVASQGHPIPFWTTTILVVHHCVLDVGVWTYLRTVKQEGHRPSTAYTCSAGIYCITAVVGCMTWMFLEDDERPTSIVSIVVALVMILVGKLDENMSQTYVLYVLVNGIGLVLGIAAVATESLSMGYAVATYQTCILIFTILEFRPKDSDSGNVQGLLLSADFW